MMTDDLINALVADLKSSKPARPRGWWLFSAAMASLLIVYGLLGVRSDWISSVQEPAAWVKAAYALALASSGLWLTQRLGRPGASIRAPLCTLLAIICVASGAAALQLSALTAADRLVEVLGGSWRVCSAKILMVSVLTGPLVFLSARGLAPTHRMAAGAALGLTAGAFSAAAYGLLRCPETSAAFIAAWYTTGVAIAAVIGALAGRVALRW